MSGTSGDPAFPKSKPDAPTPSTSKDQGKQIPAAALEEDDEFEDFPVDDWQASEQEGNRDAGEQGAGAPHLWEESWDDDDTNEEFSKQLKKELEAVKAGK